MKDYDWTKKMKPSECEKKDKVVKIEIGIV